MIEIIEAVVFLVDTVQSCRLIQSFQCNMLPPS
jgi:hypothetical protein